MKKLEEAAFPFVEPVILGGTPTLTQEAQLHIAKLATNIALVGEMLAQSEFESPQETRSRFMGDKIPPADLQLFIARVAQPINDPAFRTSALQDIEIDGTRKLLFRSFNIQMGALLIHGVTMGDDYGIHPLQYCANYGLALIWPFHSEINMALMPTLAPKQILELRFVLQNTLGPVKYTVMQKPVGD